MINNKAVLPNPATCMASKLGMALMPLPHW
jgi:hypothetical protein